MIHATKTAKQTGNTGTFVKIRLMQWDKVTKDSRKKVQQKKKKKKERMLVL